MHATETPGTCRNLDAAPKTATSTLHRRATRSLEPARSAPSLERRRTVRARPDDLLAKARDTMPFFSAREFETQAGRSSRRRLQKTRCAEALSRQSRSPAPLPSPRMASARGPAAPGTSHPSATPPRSNRDGLPPRALVFLHAILRLQLKSNLGGVERDRCELRGRVVDSVTQGAASAERRGGCRGVTLGHVRSRRETSRPIPALPCVGCTDRQIAPRRCTLQSHSQ